MARFADDTTKDVTKSANLQVANAKLAKLDGDVLKPLDDGTTELTANLGTLSVKAPLSRSRSPRHATSSSST